MDLNRTPLHALHRSLSAKMVPFAGYEMPVQYAGVMAEHLHTRASAGLFDVSHMGQVRLSGATWDAVALAFETLVPQDVLGLAPGRQRYGFFTNEGGGIEDDLMFARDGDDLVVVVNAACKDADLARMQGLEIQVSLLDRALIALQGPKAEAALARIAPQVLNTRFMDLIALPELDGWATRSGYTGEDGFEISVPAGLAVDLAGQLLAMEEVAPVGLGARDSLRLEAGLCLYGADIDARTSPAEAGLTWAIQKARRPGGSRVGGYPGAGRELAMPGRVRVGLLPEGRAPMRGGVSLHGPNGGDEVGVVTSGGFGPSLGAPVAMGYVRADLAAPGTLLAGLVRGRHLPVRVAALPFVPARFKR